MVIRMWKQFKMWVKLNKGFVAALGITFGYTFVMLAIILVITLTDKEGESWFTSRVNQKSETVTELTTETEEETPDADEERQTKMGDENE